MRHRAWRRFVKHHLSGVAGYACLGLLLGLLPFVSVFVGIPVEVRHITLASASLAYCWWMFWPKLEFGGFLEFLVIR